MAWAEIKIPVRPAPTPKWSLATTGNRDSTLKAMAFMISVTIRTLRMTVLFTEYLNPRETVFQKAYGDGDRAGPRPFITKMRRKAMTYTVAKTP